MNIVKIAQEVIAQFLNRQAIEGGLQELNKHLYDIASSMGIEVVAEGGSTFNFVSSAISAVHAAGASGSDAEVIAVEVIGKLVFREPDQVKKLNKSYVKSSVVPGLVAHFKSTGLSYEELKKEPRIIKMVADYELSDAFIKDCYDGKKKTNVPEGAKLGDEWVKTFLKKLDGLPTGRFKSTVRDNIFAEFKAEKGKFSAFWYTSVKNSARDVIKKLYRQDSILEDSLRFAPKGDKDDYTPGTISDDVAKKEHSSLNKTEAKLMKNKLITEANKLNPLYGKALKLIAEGRDLFHDGEHFQTDLKLTPKEFAKFKVYFLQDLKKLFHRFRLDTFDDGEAVLKAASRLVIAERILQKKAEFDEHEIKKFIRDNPMDADNREDLINWACEKFDVPESDAGKVVRLVRELSHLPS